MKQFACHHKYYNATNCLDVIAFVPISQYLSTWRPLSRTNQKVERGHWISRRALVETYACIPPSCSSSPPKRPLPLIVYPLNFSFEGSREEPFASH
ncbi:hypothetical protein EYC84_011376 [Monilinia fructicola]|uniref:Uncharacterized protein n=1 Tax=Monilinia fructicola TaxID=38448 RepID=A0A5M9J998_MONFR|nr:hypothetical protein EYC84_011376 [Monilinia fructicola]